MTMVMPTVTETRVVIFSACDHDCDGTTTAFYRIRTSWPLSGHVTMPDDMWNAIFGGSHYFGPSDLFIRTVRDADDALTRADSIFGGDCRPRWYAHGNFEHFSVRGVW